MRLAKTETAQRICLLDATPTRGLRCLPYSRAFDIRGLMRESSGMLSAVAFQEAVQNVGATSLDQVVIYDRDDEAASLTLWRFFHRFGHSDTCVLAGGLKAWAAAGGELVDRYTKHDRGTWRALAADAATATSLAESNNEGM